jgi:hypothetical protein
MGDLKFCMGAFKKLEDNTLKYPLTVYEYLVPEVNLASFAHGPEYNSCRSEVVKKHTQLEASFEQFIKKTSQHKRSSQSKISENSNKRVKFN